MLRFLISIIFCAFSFSSFASLVGSYSHCESTSYPTCADRAFSYDQDLSTDLVWWHGGVVGTCGDKCYFLTYSIGHCPAGSTLVQGTTGSCLCDHYESAGGGSISEACGCQDGWIPVNGSCDRPQPDCGQNGFYTNSFGAKECNPECSVGEEVDPVTHTCTAITCPSGYVLVGNDCIVVCGSGTHSENNVCVQDEPICPSGQHVSGGVCVTDTAACPSGQHVFGGACIADSVSGGIGGTSCPSGQHLVAGLCVADASGSGSSGSGDSSGSGSIGSNPNPIEGSGTAGASSDCSAPPKCTGTDQVACALLDQQWRTMCANNRFSKDDLNQSALNTQPSALYKDSSTDPGLDLSSKMSEVLNQSGVGGTCPEPQHISLSYGSFDVSYQAFCDLSSRLSGFVILLFSLIASRIVFQAFQSS